MTCPSLPLNPDSGMLEILSEEAHGGKLALCHTCGACLSRCHLRDVVPEANPRRFVRMVANGWEEAALESRFLWTCTLCNRCTFDCPMGLRMDEVVRAARGVQARRGQTPPVLQEGIQSALETGNVSMIPKEEFVETAEWLEEELQGELEDEAFRFPLDVKGAKYVYLPNPREINIVPMHLMQNALLLNELGETWTLGSEISDVTNWGYFAGDRDATRRIALRVAEAVETLEAENLVLTECGHAFWVYARNLEHWIGRKPRFRVLSMIELIDQGIREGRLRLDPEKNPQLTTYHDPCNLGRKGGLLEEPRRVLKAAVKEFVEMRPCGMEGWCCGGGGGVDRVPESTDTRLQTGKYKMDQIAKTGARVVATGCLSCQSTLNDLKKHYKVNVEILTVTELASRALVRKADGAA
ncbi:MAG: (Fe-S)-binding protein [bacterium]